MNLLSVARDLWGAGAGLPARAALGARPSALAADRGVDPDLPVRDAVRALDGLRGLPALADARGVGRPPRQRAGGRQRARAHRPDHHRRGDHHDRRVLRLHLRLVRGPAGVRHRALGGDPARRDGRPRPARPRPDEAAGRLELVPAGAGAPGPAPRALQARDADGRGATDDRRNARKHKRPGRGPEAPDEPVPGAAREPAKAPAIRARPLPAYADAAGAGCTKTGIRVAIGCGGCAGVAP